MQFIKFSDIIHTLKEYLKLHDSENTPRKINLAIFHKTAYISDVLSTWEIILFLVSKCTILGSKDAKVEGESLFTELPNENMPI